MRPVDGEVVAVNETLDATPELVNSDPYGGGWLYELVPADAGAVDALLDAAAYQASSASDLAAAEARRCDTGPATADSDRARRAREVGLRLGDA